MGYETRKLKTEHAGGKNGGGFWGPRVDAKQYSRKARRVNDRTECTFARRGQNIVAKLAGVLAADEWPVDRDSPDVRDAWRQMMTTRSAAVRARARRRLNLLTGGSW
jgi:hypothetical protein